MRLELKHYRIALHLLVVLIFIVAIPLTTLLYSDVNNQPFPRFSNQLKENEILIGWLTFGSLLAPFYFFNTYWLLPRYLGARKYLQYGLLILACFIATAFVIKQVETVLMKMGSIGNSLPYPALFLPMTLLLGLGTSFEMILQWEAQTRKQQTIEKEKVTAELSFLKSQVNPHFLFNTLNNIYSLAERNSPATGQAILLLSNLMRYILYETNRGKILFSREAQHLEDYIALNKLRIADTEMVVISFTNTVALPGLMIEPLLFIPFIENSFKHGVSYTTSSYINISIVIENQHLVFTTVNSKKKNSHATPDANHRGIGITNTKRRLELLYGGRHELIIKDEADSYQVSLDIALSTTDDFS